jgi:dienelactone hydrolase
MRSLAVFAAVLISVAVPRSGHADGPALPTPRTLDGGITAYSVHLTGSGPGQTMGPKIYLPAGAHADHSLPCVFVAPAGSNLITGNSMGDSDSPEQLPYATAGFAVVGYDLDGEMPAKTTSAMLASIPTFMAAHGGLDNARAAVDYALAHLPSIDPDRLYVAGHSSAATVALDVTAADPRIKACCAYAPCPDVGVRLKPRTVAAIDQRISGFAAFVDDISPARHVAAFKGRSVLLFTALDDSNVPSVTVQQFAADLAKTPGVTVKLVTVPTGDHYWSMRRAGIPAGIAFLKGLAKN